MPRRPPPSLRQRALDLLARRDYSRDELYKKLTAKVPDCDTAELDELLTRLTELGMQSDERAATAELRRTVAVGKGPRYLAQRLFMRGLASVSLELEIQEVDWVSLCATAYADALNHYNNDHNKAAAKVSRLGFDYSMISKAKRPDLD